MGSVQLSTGQRVMCLRSMKNLTSSAILANRLMTAGAVCTAVCVYRAATFILCMVKFC